MQAQVQGTLARLAVPISLSFAWATLLEDLSVKGHLPLCWSQEESPLRDPRACIVPCAPVQGSWSMLPGALWQKSYFRFSLLFLLIIHAAVFQHFVTISVSFTGGWVFTASSYKLGTWNMRKRRAFFMELLGYWCFKLSTIWYPGNRWQSRPVNLQLAFSLLDNSSPSRGASFINKFMTWLFYHWSFCVDRFEVHDFTRIHKMKQTHGGCVVS